MVEHLGRSLFRTLGRAITQRLSLPKRGQAWSAAWRPFWVPLALLIAACIFIMSVQVADTGFRRGHRGWVSSHLMAIFAHASPENNFVAYSLAFDGGEERGKTYSYFDRYPVFYAATMHAILYTFDLSLSERVIVARLIMLLIHALTLIFAFLLLLELGVHRWLALAAVCSTAASHYFVYYRDMIHFDNPALLGVVFLCWAVARHRNQRRPWFVFAASLVAVSLGRGYASFGVLAVWWVVELVEAIHQYRFHPVAVIRHMFTNVASWSCVGAIAISVGYLAYNVTQEAALRDVDVEQVSIVNSAKRRLPGTNTGDSGKTQWGNFLNAQGNWIVKGFHPYGVGTGFSQRTLPLYWALALVATMILLFIASLRGRRRGSAVVVALCGVVWLFGMRKLAAWHDFTMIYYLGTFLVAQVSFWRVFPAHTYRLAACLALALLVLTTWVRAGELRLESLESNSITEDFEAIAARLNRGDTVRIHGSYRNLIGGVPLPYILGFYLADQYLASSSSRTRYVVRRGRRASLGTNLTPRNNEYFLYQRQLRPN